MPLLRLLGGAVVTGDDGGTADISSRRHPIALLALLATAPSLTLSRGKLVGLLWPETTEQTARNRLTSCVYDVRTSLGSTVLVTTGEDLRFDPDALSCDVVRFAAALATEDYEGAVALYGGPFLDGFRLGGSPDFEQRMDRERDRLRWSYHRALEQIAARARDRDGPEAAAHWWRVRAADDPYDSRIAGELIGALAAAGNRAEALRAADQHVRLLDEEFGAAPDPALQRIIDGLRAAPARGGEHDEEYGATRLDRASLVRSIAVLPFENIGNSSETAPFAAGLHEDLLTELCRISALTVIARSSVERYRSARRPVAEIARELGVGTIVEGSVQSAGGRVRLNVQLIDAHTEAHRWVERYDRDLRTDNIFDIQGELAVRIAHTLHAELTPAERTRVGIEPTRDQEAFRLYAQGRALLDQRTEHAIHRSIPYFQRAIERDADYALAWSGLTDAVSLLEFYHYAPAAPTIDWMHAATRAVELGPSLGQTHASLGIAHACRQDAPAALAELETAVELAPSYAEAHAWLGWVRLVLGEPGEALGPARRAVELDPLAPALRAYLALTLLANDRPRPALEEAQRARSIQSGYGLAHYTEGVILYHLGQLDDARAALQPARSLVPPRGTPSHAEIEAVLALIGIATGDRAAGAAALERIDEDVFSAALVHAALGDAETAFAVLERVNDWRSFSAEHLRYFFPAILDPLRNDRRFIGVIERLDRSWHVR